MSDKKIMIVDDDRDMLRGLNVRLRASGYDTVFANDAISAISTAKKEKPNLIILDLGLPAGDGYVVMERLKGMTQLAAIPIVVLSARDPMFHQDRSLKAGAQAFLQKPADNDVLLAVVRKSLGDAAAQSDPEVTRFSNQNQINFIQSSEKLPLELRLLFDRLVHEYIYHSTVLHGAGYAPYEEPVPFDILAALLKEGWRPIAPAVAVEPAETQVE